MWQATRKAAELIKLVAYCNNMNAYCANLSCTHPHAQKKYSKKSYILRLILGIKPVSLQVTPVINLVVCHYYLLPGPWLPIF